MLITWKMVPSYTEQHTDSIERLRFQSWQVSPD